MRIEPLIGRHPELERIDAVLASRERLPAGLLLHGREGIGKTALWRETIRRAEEQGYRVLVCALSRNESRLTFAGLADLIGPVLGEVLPELAPPQAAALQSALAISSDMASPPDERAVAFGLHGALSVLATRWPIALAIDDVQWLDPSSTLMLSFAIRRLRDEPVVLILAQRDGEAIDHNLALLEGADDRIERILVGPMPLGAVHRLIRTRLGYSLARPQLLRIHAASDGNPLYALELARAMHGADQDDPGGLHALLANRVAVLPGTARLAVALVAIASDSDLETLGGAYGATLEADLRPAMEADLVTVAGGRVRFTHPLIAAAAESGLTESKLGELHRMLAAATTSEEARAAHLARATHAPSSDVAKTLDTAALLTRRRGARAASAALYEAAARLTPPTDPHDGARRRLAAAEAWYEAGDAQRAEEILVGLRLELGSGNQRCEAGWRLGILRDEAGRWQEATALWREALSETDDPGLESQLLCSLAITAFYTESVQDATVQAAAAVASAEKSSNPAYLARALAVHALTIAISGGTGFQPIIDRGLALEAEIDESLGDWSPSAVAAECARHAGHVEAARHHYAAVLERAINAGDANVEQWAAFGLASTEILAGGYRRASELADIVLDIADQTGQMRIPARSLRAHVDAYLGDLDSARRLVTEAMDAATAADEATHLFGALIVLGLIEVCSGNHAAAARAYADARKIAAEIGLAHATALRGFVNEAEAAAAVGELEQADDALAMFDATVKGDPPAWAALIHHRALAAMLAARGDLQGAQRELEQAVADDGPVPIDQARGLLALGSTSRRLREHARAREALGKALAIFTELGTPPWILRAEVELQRIPGRRTRPSDELTDAEARIAELVAEGRSNKDVAAALFVSVKTVEVTLTRVYQKVGVRSRAGLAHHFGAVAKQ
jgi:DNA-binding CsgD family transcriptional regulator/DNA polymerase III delta prime subunit